MSATVVDIATAETVEVEATTSTAKRRDLKKIGRNLARQITKGSFADLTVDAVMERKAVDRVQAKAVIAHAVKTLEGRGLPVPTFV